MRLHRLELAAFGPFATRQSVDFDELSAAGLFLLHGPTGAGKTSVLDGVCFALYGQVPGARPATRLRSDHAAPGDPTEVVLELTLGGRRLEITRRPEQPRAKKRGSGTTMDKAVTLLRERVDGRWRGLSRSHQEIGEEIAQLLGMSCEQFCQVVLLPQGEFANFLRAGAASRAALLGRLFDTRRFQAVEHWLRDRKAEAAQELAAGDEELRALRARMRQAAGPDASAAADAFEAAGVDAAANAGASDAADPAGALPAWAAVLRCEARERHAIAAAAVTRAEAAHAAAVSALSEARDLDALQRRRHDALARAAALAEVAPARAATRAALDLARRAATVAPALAARDRAVAQSAAAESAATRALAALTPADRSAPTDRPAPAVASAAPAAAAGGDVGSAPPRAAAGAPEPPGAAATAARAAAGAPAEGELPTAGTWPGDTSSSDARSSDARPADTRPDLPAAPKGLPGARAAQDAPAGLGAGVAAVRSAGDARDAESPRSAVGAGDARDAEGPRSTVSARDARSAGAGHLPPPVAGAQPAEGAVPGPRPERGAAADGGGRSADGAPETADAAELARRAGALRERLGALAGAAEAERRIADIEARRAALLREERADEEAVREAEAWLDAWPGTRKALRERVDAGMEAAARAAGYPARIEAARRAAEAAAERDRLTGRVSRAQDAARDARDRAATARERWQDLREARISGIAAELAEQLADGEPCRVCGALDHPDPARPAARRVGRADEEAAYADYRREQDRYEQAHGEAAGLRAALEAATAAAGPSAYPELAAEQDRLEREHRRVARAAEDVAAARAALAAAEQERDRRGAQQQAALSRAAARTSRREELDDQHAASTAELARSLDGHTDVAAHRAHLATRIDALDRAVDALRERAGCARRAAEAEAALADAASRAGFASPADAAAALLPAEQAAQSQRRVEAWAREEAALEADLAAPEPAAAADLPPARPDLAQSRLDEAGRLLRAASAAESAAATRCRELDELGAQAAARLRELGPAREEFTRLRRLSDLAAGTSAENRYRMELETYVLAARLEEVAAAAGARLQRMSAGRYTLVHSDARGGRGARSGLGLKVVDAWTGTERDTSTLSGGETFFASLSLALGLADVVTGGAAPGAGGAGDGGAAAGGARLDTLFIDEGFGSLDDQTLDEVLDVLDGLRERDRAVGIVSHVADLRHRIPVQLRVSKGREGSTVRLRTGAARS
ncbi:AAA family ATPase [Actinacidiphila sp. DG2A-62]|uniref:AAA family ATPase n=1 Tax=Actinacidiphila sp. DG2A-62 TaxID=3108821 RepID=UPI002DBBD73E|nr:AAA family ATPase [Actinacidiphila sp. DG2A-62]MEC3992282.1 AAA family ATPase [Actinacidiphila sp. DG2A-62]